MCILFRIGILCVWYQRLFSSPEPIVYQSLQRLSVLQHFQTSSSLKPLGKLNSNFIWRLLRMRERKFVQMVLFTWGRWPPRPYMLKPCKNLLLQNQKTDNFGTRYVALGMWNLPNNVKVKFCFLMPHTYLNIFFSEITGLFDGLFIRLFRSLDQNGCNPHIW